MTDFRQKRVCIIGAGISGLVTAKIMRDDGFDVSVFEQASEIGGVWVPSRTYPQLRTNSPREFYAFSDFPYPRDADDYPTAEQVRSYLTSYVSHFQLSKLIQLSTRVLSVEPVPADGPREESHFRVTLRPNDDSSPSETADYDFVAVCNGVFSKPFIPPIDGMERFTGQILHSSKLTNADLIAGKRVIVVGSGKSALDCATLASQFAQTAMLVFRSPHWMVPRYFFGFIRLDWLLFTRFMEMFYGYHRRTGFEAFLHGKGKSLVWLFWQFQSWFIPRVLRAPRIFLPRHPLPSGVENVGVGNEFFRCLREGKLGLRHASITSFTGATSMELDTGERIDTDVVVFATGWQQDISFLDPVLRNEILKDGHFHLYRHILPPVESHLGFIGYASSLACQLTSEIAAHWLSQCFLGELTLPNAQEMEREIDVVRQWESGIFPARKQGYFIGPYVAHYIDELMRDMGLKTTRTSNPVTEYFARFLPDRYKDVARERQARHHAASPT